MGIVWDNALAAEIRVVRNAPWSNVATEAPDRVTCNVTLVGEIQRGDLAKLRHAFQSLRRAETPPSLFGFCLASRGGSFQEGLAISRFLLGPEGRNINTVIEAGSECYSACALIFMAGNNTGDGHRFPGRWLHMLGKLAFHAPHLDSLPDAQYDRQSVINAFKAAQLGIQELVDIFSVSAVGLWTGEGQPWVRPSLFQLLLAQEPNQLFFIDSVDRAGRWGILVYGYDHPRYDGRLAINSYKTPCRNQDYWLRDRYAGEGISSDLRVSGISLEDRGSLVTREAVVLDDKAGRYCVPGGVFYTPRAHYLLLFEISLYTKSSGDMVRSSSLNFHIQPWTMFPPATKLRSLPKPQPR